MPTWATWLIYQQPFLSQCFHCFVFPYSSYFPECSLHLSRCISLSEISLVTSGVFHWGGELVDRKQKDRNIALLGDIFWLLIACAQAAISPSPLSTQIHQWALVGDHYSKGSSMPDNRHQFHWLKKKSENSHRVRLDLILWYLLWRTLVIKSLWASHTPTIPPFTPPMKLLVNLMV